MIAVFLLVLSGSGALHAHFGDLIYPVFEVPPGDIPVIGDGTLEDWDAALPNVTLTHNEVSTQFGTLPNPSDLAFQVFLAWSSQEQQIYVAFEGLDDYEEEGDSFRIAVDADHSGGRFRFLEDEVPSEDERRSLNGQTAQRYLIGRNTETGELRLRIWPDEPIELLSKPWTDWDAEIIGEQPLSFRIEMAITPFDAIRTDIGIEAGRAVLEAGNFIGFQIRISDIDRNNDGELHFLPPYGSGFTEFSRTNWDADFFADGELIGCEQPGCAIPSTSVGKNSWGRIKASFR